MSIVVKSYNDLKQLLNSEENIFVFGAGKFGTRCLDEVNFLIGNLSKISAVVDNDEKKQGTAINGITVCSLMDVAERYKQGMFIIALKDYERVLDMLDVNPKFDGWSCCVYHVLEEGWEYSSVEELRVHKRINETVMRQYAMNLRSMAVEEKQKLLERKKQELQSGKKIMAKMVFIATNRCTLRCKDCLGRVPYFKNPQDMELSTILRDMELFLQCIDECIAVEIAGGEPLLYADLDVLLDYLIKSKKVLGIRLTTNGTVVPNPKVLERLAHSKVQVGISDYGLIEKLAQVVSVFEKNKIDFVLHSEMTWVDPGDLSKRNRTTEALKEQFEKCWDAFNCKSIVNGRLFACPRYARAYMQNEQEFEKDSVSLLDYEDIEERRKAIFDLYMVDYAEACDYCNFGTKDCKMIKAGIQMNGAFQRSEYTLVKRGHLK